MGKNRERVKGRDGVPELLAQSNSMIKIRGRGREEGDRK